MANISEKIRDYETEMVRPCGEKGKRLAKM